MLIGIYELARLTVAKAIAPTKLRQSTLDGDEPKALGEPTRQHDEKPGCVGNRP